MNKMVKKYRWLNDLRIYENTTSRHIETNGGLLYLLRDENYESISMQLNWVSNVSSMPVLSFTS